MQECYKNPTRTCYCNIAILAIKNIKHTYCFMCTIKLTDHIRYYEFHNREIHNFAICKDCASFVFTDFFLCNGYFPKCSCDVVCGEKVFDRAFYDASVDAINRQKKQQIYVATAITKPLTLQDSILKV